MRDSRIDEVGFWLITDHCPTGVRRTAPFVFPFLAPLLHLSMISLRVRHFRSELRNRAIRFTARLYFLLFSLKIKLQLSIKSRSCALSHCICPVFAMRDSLLLRIHPLLSAWLVACSSEYQEKGGGLGDCDISTVQSKTSHDGLVQLLSVHPETPDETLAVFDSERRHFSSWQGNRGVARRRTWVRRTSKPKD